MLNKHKSLIINVLSIILILFPIIFLGMVFQKYAINIPHWDDHALKGFVLNFEKIDSFIEKIKLILSQHNEHRIALTRIFTLIILQIKGTIEYKWLMFIGGISLIGILFVFQKILKKYNYQIYFLIPISFLIFGFYSYENLFWGMASVQNFWVVFLAIWVFYLVAVSNKKYAIYLAIFLSFLATNTSGNGFLIPLISFLILAFQKRKRDFLIYFIPSTIFIFIYFYFYQKPPVTSFTAPVRDPYLIIQGLIAMMGSAVDFTLINTSKQVDVATVVGIVLLISIVFLFWNLFTKKYNVEMKNIDVFFGAIILFCIGTIGAVVLNRLNMGLPALLTSKYKIYSILLLIVFYIIAVHSLSINAQKRFVNLCILVSIGFWFYGYVLDYQAIANMRQERICELINSKSLGTYPYNPIKTTLNDLELNTSTIDSTMRPYQIEMKPNYLKIKEPIGRFDFDFKSADNGLYLVLKSDKKAYVLPTVFYVNSKKERLKMASQKSFHVIGHGFESSNFGVVDGKYRIGLIKVENEVKWLRFTNQIVDIQGVTRENESKNW